MVKSVVDMITDARAQIELVTPEAASNEMATGDPILVDVREPVEWERHIAGAVQVPRGLLEFVADPTSPRYNDALRPKEMGYENVANMDGGLKAWIAAGLPTAEHHSDI